MGQTFHLFVFKWHLFEKFISVYRLDERFKENARSGGNRSFIDPAKLKLSIRPPLGRTAFHKMSPDDLLNLNSQFSAMLKDGPKAEQVDWLCADLRAALPGIGLSVSDWADNTTLVVFAGKLHTVAKDQGWLSGLNGADGSFVLALRDILTGDGRLAGNDQNRMILASPSPWRRSEVLERQEAQMIRASSRSAMLSRCASCLRMASSENSMFSRGRPGAIPMLRMAIR